MTELPLYPYIRPAEMDGARAEPHPVAIVGAGLSGLTLALDLVRRGIPVAVSYTHLTLPTILLV